MRINIEKVLVLCLLICCLTALVVAQDRMVLVAHYGAGSQDRADVTSILQSMVRNGALNFVVSSDLLGGGPQWGTTRDLEIVVREASGRISEYRFRDGESVNLSLRGYGFSGNRLPEAAQRQFDDLYIRWLGYREQRNHESADDMERRMRDLMRTYNVPPETPFNVVASPGIGASRPGWNELRIERATYGTSSNTVDVTARLQSMVRDNAINLHVIADNLGEDPAPGQFKQLYVTYFYQGQERQVVVDEKDFLKIP